MNAENCPTRGEIHANPLTDKETKILKLIWSGMTANKQLACQMDMSISSVSNHLSKIYDKLEVSGEKGETIKIDAICKGIQLGILEPYKPSIDETKTPIYLLGLDSHKSK